MEKKWWHDAVIYQIYPKSFLDSNGAGKKVLLTLVCAALTIALGACSGDKAGKESSQITIGIPQDVDSLDPHKAVAAGTKEVLFNVFEGLVKPDSEGNLNDAVAESHTISEDGKVYTFTLRDGVKFHDGTTVTAEDVKYSIDRCAVTVTRWYRLFWRLTA